MQIHYHDKKLREICEKQAVAQKKLGTDCAKKLQWRLAELAAAANVGELVAGRPHPLKGERQGRFALSLAGGYRLVFAPKHDPVPTRADGSTDWAQITIISIEYIGDYHE